MKTFAPMMTVRTPASAAGYVATVLLASACSFAPPAQPPATPNPAQYGTQPLPSQTASAQGVAQQFEQAGQPIPQWWRAFGSPAIDALVEEGLAHSPDLNSAEHRLAAARHQLNAQIGSTELPSVDAAVQATRQNALGLPIRSIDLPGLPAPIQLPTTSQYNTFGGQIRASYTLDLFGSVRYGNAAATARVDEQALRLEAARRSLAANIVNTAITSAALARQYELSKQQAMLARQVALDTRRRHELGSASQAESLDAQRNADTLDAGLPALQAQTQAARHALAILVGRTPDQAPDALDFDTISVPPRLPVAVPSELLQARPDVQGAQANLRAAAADVGQATANLFPSLSLTAAYGKAGYDWSTVTSGAGTIWSIGASLTQPIFHGGALRSQRKAAQEQYQAAIDQYRQTVLQSFRQVADSLSALEAGAQALASAEAARQAAEDAHLNTARRVELGALPRYMARASEQAALQARQRELSYASARLQDTATLFTALGSPLRAP